MVYRGILVCASYNLGSKFHYSGNISWVATVSVHETPSFDLDIRLEALIRLNQMLLLLFVSSIFSLCIYLSLGISLIYEAVNESHAAFGKTSESKQSASSVDRSVTITVEWDQFGRIGSFNSPWTKLVMDMYPHGSSLRTWTCSHCNIVQPPRAKHCHDCDKCVLKFDHHCVWLGTCIGQDNHFRFWWYIVEENILCFWTVILYISYLRSDTPRAWWVDAIMILLLATLFVCTIFIFLLLIFHNYLILTNQTTFELVRKRRIQYLRGIPAKVFPFSKGICRNMSEFCCTWGKHNLESVPPLEELEERSRPYTCSDVLCCRCC